MTERHVRSLVSAGLLITALVASVVYAPSSASAYTPVGSDWDAGSIISDAQFYDYNSMTEAEIQAFLEARVPVCETWRSSGPGDPIVCLKDYRMSTIAKAADAFCPSPYEAGTNERASTIIYKVAQACKISPKVLLVTLQKENGLVTSTWPSTWRYTSAMGYGCSDTSACIEAYGGFQKQVYLAAKQFQRYRVNPTGYHYRAGQKQYIYYYPPNSRDCGRSSVYIKNVATASLYNYTPYQPDETALANVTGLGGYCASYGNRNFWRDYTIWFGDPQTGAPAGVTVDRIGGATRYDVAVTISKQYFPAGAATVFVATGENFPDALGAAPAAANLGGPLLLVPGTSLPASVGAELRRLAPTKIIVAGGPATVSKSVIDALKLITPNVVRHTGADRYEVSRSVVRDAFMPSGSNIAYIATGETFPDALSASAAAGSLDAPVILVPGLQGTLGAETITLLSDLGVTEVRIAGGPASVSPGIESQLRTVAGITTVSRLGGQDRYQVSGATNRAVFTSATTVFVASGLTFPDALSGAAVAGGVGAPLYVIPSNCIPNYVVDDIINFGATKVTILGGEGSITQDVASFKRCR